MGCENYDMFAEMHGVHPIKRTATMPELVAALEAAGYTVTPPKPKVWPFFFATVADLFNQNKYWVTSDGEMWCLEDMSLDHINNVRRYFWNQTGYLRRQCEMTKDQFYTTPLYKEIRAHLVRAANDPDTPRKYDWHTTKGQPVRVFRP